MSLYTCPHCHESFDSLTAAVTGTCPHCRQSVDPDASTLKQMIESVWGETLNHAQETAPGQEETIRRPSTGHRDPYNMGGVCLRRQQISALNQPQAIGDEFDLRSVLGEGGMGTVYCALQGSVDREVALKRIKLSAAHDAEMRAKFLAEALVTGNLEHPNIPPVYEIGEDAGGSPFYAMKQIHGEPWSERITAMSIQENLEILLKVADALAFAHDKGILHRDLKPSNVMLGDYGEVLVMDWGLALNIGNTGHGERIDEHTSIGGTPAYMPPEVARGENQRIGYHSDIYLLGAMLYELIASKPPHSGTNTLDCLANACRNIIQPTTARSALLAIALKAMASDHSLRHKSVSAFQQSIRDYLTHAESDQLCMQAEGELTEAEYSVTYDAYLRAQAKFRQAIELWPQNVAASDGLRRCNLTYAHTAYRRGDLDLAWQLLDRNDDSHIPLWNQINRAYSRRRRLDWRRSALVILTILLVIPLGFLAIRWALTVEQSAVSGSWKTRRQLILAPDSDLHGISLHTAPDTLLSPRLTSDGLQMTAGSWLWFDALDLPGSVRVDFTITWPEQVDGIEVLINSDHDGQDLGLQQLPDGYSCQFGGWEGLDHSIAINRPGKAHSYLDGIAAELVAGRRYLCSFERLGDRLAIYLDGHLIHQRHDLLSHRIHSHGGLGIRSWGDCHIESLAVFARKGNDRPPALLGADTLAAHGHLRSAYDYYRTIAENDPQPELALLAGLRQFSLGLELGLLDDQAATALREGLATLPGAAPYRQTLAEIQVLQCWLDGRHDQALAALPALFAHWPQTRVALHMLSAQRSNLHPETAHRLLEWVAHTQRLNRLDLSNMGLHSLGPIGHLRLRSLNCSGNNLHFLRFLRDMPLQQLDCALNPITDLQGLPLRSLRQLTLDNCQIERLDMLAGSPLETLHANGNRITDLSPLAHLPLRHLRLRDNQIRDITALHDLPLITLDLTRNQITDLGALADRPLRQLQLAGNPLAGLEALRGLDLEILDISACGITDLSPLRGMPLRLLRMNDNAISTLDALATSPLQRLYAARNRLTHLDGLTTAALRELQLTANPLHDISPLRDGTALTLLSLNDCPIDDYEPLLGLPLRHLHMARPDLDLATLDHLIARADAHLAQLLRHNRHAVLALREAWAPLQAAAVPVGARRRLFLPLDVTHSEAVALARACGARLLSFDHAEEVPALRTWLRTQGCRSIWLGLQPIDHTLRWANGHPLVYRPHALPQRLLRQPGAWHLFLGNNLELWRPIDPQAPCEVVLEWPAEGSPDQQP